MNKLLATIAIGLSLHGNAVAGFTEGANAFNARNYPLALKEIRPLAEQGHADAQYLLGLMYYTGRGVARDYERALQWHRKAAVQGKSDAQYVLGAMYYTGNAVQQDRRCAISWFRKAAEQGHPDAQHALGLMYRNGTDGVSQDMVLSYVLLNLAAASGNANAIRQRAAIARHMTQEQIEEAHEMSRSWRPGMRLPRSSN